MSKIIVRLVDPEGGLITSLKVPPSTVFEQLIRFVVARRSEWEGRSLRFKVGGRRFDPTDSIDRALAVLGLTEAGRIEIEIDGRNGTEERGDSGSSTNEPESSSGEDESFWRREMRKTVRRTMRQRRSESRDEEEEPAEDPDAASALGDTWSGARSSEKGSGGKASNDTAKFLDPWGEDPPGDSSDEISPVEEGEDAEAVTPGPSAGRLTEISQRLRENLAAVEADLDESVPEAEVDSAEDPSEDSLLAEAIEGDHFLTAESMESSALLAAEAEGIDDLDELHEVEDAEAEDPVEEIEFGDVPDEVPPAEMEAPPAPGASAGWTEEPLDLCEDVEPEVEAEPEPEAEPEVEAEPEPEAESEAEAGVETGAFDAVDFRRKASTESPAPASDLAPEGPALTGPAPRGAVANLADSLAEPPKKPEVFDRRATARYFRQMNPLRVFPLVVFFSEKKIERIEVEGVAQAEARRSIRVTEEDPHVDLVPHFPGCLVTPERSRLDVKGSVTRAVFEVTPLAEGMLSTARVDIFHGGRKVEEIATPTRVVKLTSARVAVAASVVGPVFSTLLETLAVDRGGAGSAPVRLLRWVLESVGGWTGLGFVFGAVSLAAGGFFYFLRRPEEADPVQSMMEVDDWLKGDTENKTDAAG